MGEPISTGPLSLDEAEQMRRLLIRYCANELDQFDLWRTTGPYGTAYITIARYPNGDAGQSPDAWISIDEPSGEVPGA